MKQIYIDVAEYLSRNMDLKFFEFYGLKAKGNPETSLCLSKAQTDHFLRRAKVKTPVE
jgi:hypothetical protein